MTTWDAETMVGSLVADRPARARVFEPFGIDYCCGGKRTLGQACERAGIDLDEVVAALTESDIAATNETNCGDEGSTITELADHIVATHHANLRRELPRLAAMLDKVVAAHGERHAELPDLRAAFTDLRNELEPHIEKEERILFPMIRELERAASAPAFHCGTVNNPIRAMEDEHRNAGRALTRMRDLTGGYAPPDDACNTYLALLDGLADLERDLHTHIHKENNILFPQAADAERRCEPRTE